MECPPEACPNVFVKPSDPHEENWAFQMERDRCGKMERRKDKVTCKLELLVTPPIFDGEAISGLVKMNVIYFVGTVWTPPFF